MSPILAVDNKHMMHDSVTTMLARIGQMVVSAASHAEAMQRLAEAAADAVIIDMQSADTAGVHLLAEIKRLNHSMPVSLLSASGSVEAAVSAMKQGASDYLTRPITDETLRMAVAKAMEHVRPIATRNGTSHRPAAMVEVVGDVAPQIVDARAIVCDGRVTLDDIEREIIVATLGHNNGHRQRSAAALGIGVRTLGLKLKKWKEEKLVSESL